MVCVLPKALSSENCICRWSPVFPISLCLMHLHLLTEHSAERKAFETGLKGDLASALGLPSTCFHIVSLCPGSVIAHIQISSDPQGSGPGPEVCTYPCRQMCDRFCLSLQRRAYSSHSWHVYVR